MNYLEEVIDKHIKATEEPPESSVMWCSDGWLNIMRSIAASKGGEILPYKEVPTE